MHKSLASPPLVGPDELYPSPLVDWGGSSSPALRARGDGGGVGFSSSPAFWARDCDPAVVWAPDSCSEFIAPHDPESTPDAP
eukprot:10203483-Karenia_brevis.AAC.1